MTGRTKHSPLNKWQLKLARQDGRWFHFIETRIALLTRCRKVPSTMKIKMMDDVKQPLPRECTEALLPPLGNLGTFSPMPGLAWTHAHKSSNPLQSCPTPVPVRVWLSGGRDEQLLRDFRFCCGPYATSSSQRLLSRVPAQVLDTKRKPHADLTGSTPCSKTTARISMTAHFWGRTSFCSDLPLRPQHLTIPPNAPIKSS